MLSRSKALVLLLLIVVLAAALPLVITPDSISADSTGLTSPNANQPSSGDGFEVSPASAYTDDGAYAENIDGAGQSHIYYNYGFAIPGDATVKGIEVRLDWYLDSDNGTSSMGVELSWNGGANWTAVQTDSVESTAEHSATLGTPTDNWGRAWNPLELSNGNFRVRVTCNSDDLARDFYLDWVAVNIHYAPVAWLQVTGSGTMTAGGTNQLTVTARDNEGNVAVNYSGSKTLVFSGPSAAPGGQTPTIGGVALGNGLPVNFTNGVSAAGTTALVAYRAETTTVDVTDGTINSFGSAAYDLDLIVSPATASRLEVAGTATMTAGTTNELTITAKDTYGNTDTNYAGSKTLTFSGPNASPGGQTPTVEGVNIGLGTTVSFSAGISAAGGATLIAYRAETVSVDVSDGSVSSSGSTTYDLDLTVSPAAASRLEVTGTAVMTAGTTNELTITAKDTYGNTDTSYTGLRALTFSGPGTAPGGQAPTVESVNVGVSTAVSFNAGVSASGAATLTAYRAETTTVDVTDGGIGSGASPAYDLELLVNPGTASQLDLTPDGGTAGSGIPFTVTVTAQDAYLNVATIYAGTVTFASSDGSATLPPDYAYNGGDSGVHAFTNGVTLITSGSQTVSVTDTVNGTMTDTETWSVSAASAARLEVTGSATMTAGSTNELTVTARDSVGNIDTSYSGPKTLTFSGPGVAPGLQVPTIETTDVGLPVSINFTNGVSDAGAVTLSAYRAEVTTVEATDGIVSSAGFGLALTVSPAPTTRLDLTPDGGSATSGVAFTVTVTAQDLYLNGTPGYAGTVTFSSSDNASGVVLPAPYIFGPSDDGTHEYTNAVTLITAGSQTLAISDGTLSDITTWNVGAATTTDHIVISPVAATVIAGDNVTYTVEAFDMYNNSLGDVTSGTILSIDVGAGGVWASNVYSSQYAGTWTVSGDYTGVLGSASLTVQAGPASSIVITPDSPSVAAGSSVAYTAQALDQYNNSAGDVTGSTAFSIDPLAGGSWANNVYTSQYAGTWTVTGDYSGMTDSDLLTVTAGPATLVVITPADATLAAGSTLAYTATATDQFNNSLGDVSSTTSFSIDPGAGGSWSLNVYTAQYVGIWTITGDYTGIVGTASLTVTGGPISYYTVTSDNYSLETSIAFTVTVTAYDAYSNVAINDNTTVVTMSSSSSTMIFDGNDNGLFGQPGDNVKTLSAGTFDIQAKDNTATEGITITASDGSIEATSGTYTVENFRCFIATAAYGTPMAGEIQILRDFRDRYLLTNPPGRLFVSTYYRLSPPVAGFIADHDSLRAAIRFGLTPVLWLASAGLKATLLQKLAILGLVLAATLVAVVSLRRIRRARPSWTSRKV